MRLVQQLNTIFFFKRRRKIVTAHSRKSWKNRPSPPKLVQKKVTAALDGKLRSYFAIWAPLSSIYHTHKIYIYIKISYIKISDERFGSFKEIILMDLLCIERSEQFYREDFRDVLLCTSEHKEQSGTIDQLISMDLGQFYCH